MIHRIEGDKARFREKLKRLRQDGLEDYFSTDIATIPTDDGRVLRVPIPDIAIPQFEFNPRSHGYGGVGQGDGNVGDLLDDGVIRPGHGGHGKGGGEHFFDYLSIDDAGEILGAALRLPNLLEKAEGNLEAQTERRYTGIRRVGPVSLTHRKLSLKRALLRTIASGAYSPRKPVVVVRPEDRRYRAPKEIVKPNTRAAIIYLRDCSGSTEGVLDFMRNVGWWADAWIRHCYHHVERAYILYDWDAFEVPFQKFYSVNAEGGTRMYAGLSLAKDIAKRRFPSDKYNLYLIHFTDGDCWGIELDREGADNYLTRKKDSSEEFDVIRVTPGNPLLDFFVPHARGIFVCEAGANYNGQQFTVNGKEMTGNYSALLQHLLDQTPDLEKKLRYVSYTDTQLAGWGGKLVGRTLHSLFK